MKKLFCLIKMPFEDFIAGLEAALNEASSLNIAVVLLCFIISWWVYVPLHELLHAFGCLAGGGEVSRLEISPLYGASLLRDIFPFVAVGSEYAGQLTGFDTKGSDLIYLLTDFFPFLMTIFIGVPLLKSAGRSTPLSASLKLGLALPVAFAPFISLSGDYYETGSIIVSRMYGMISPGFDTALWRSDDIFRLVGGMIDADKFYGINIIGVLLSAVLGLALAYGTYLLGSLWSGMIFKSSLWAK